MNIICDPATRTAPDVSSARDLALDDALVSQALTDGADRRGDRATRHDGWTPDKIRTFLQTLAETGIVSRAAAAAGMSLQSAYRLRSRVEGCAFHYAWEGALQIAKRHIADGLVDRAIAGCVDRIVRNGVVVAERHRFDNRLAVAALTRLDNRIAADHDEAEALRIIVEDFESFTEIASHGGAGAAGYIADRRPLGSGAGRAERLLSRLDEPSSSRLTDAQNGPSGP